MTNPGSLHHVLPQLSTFNISFSPYYDWDARRNSAGQNRAGADTYERQGQPTKLH